MFLSNLLDVHSKQSLAAAMEPPAKPLDPPAQLPAGTELRSADKTKV